MSMAKRTVLSMEDNYDEHMGNGQMSKYGPQHLVTTEVAGRWKKQLFNKWKKALLTNLTSSLFIVLFGLT
jgi:hypothetical protein